MLAASPTLRKQKNPVLPFSRKMRPFLRENLVSPDWLESVVAILLWGDELGVLNVITEANTCTIQATKRTLSVPRNEEQNS